jgi:hypothetical protein
MNEQEMRRASHDAMMTDYQRDCALWYSEAKNKNLSHEDWDNGMRMRAKGLERRLKDMHESYDRLKWTGYPLDERSHNL